MKYLPLALIGLLLLSCADNSAPVLTQLSRSVEHDQKLVRGVNFGRTLSLTAAVPFSDVGNVWRYDQKKGYTTAIGVTRNRSYVSRTRVVAPNGYDEEDLENLHVALLQLQNLAAARVAARFDQLVTEAGSRANRLATAAADKQVSNTTANSNTASNNISNVPNGTGNSSAPGNQTPDTPQVNGSNPTPLLPPTEPIDPLPENGNSRFLLPPKSPAAAIRRIDDYRVFAIANGVTEKKGPDTVTATGASKPSNKDAHQDAVDEYNKTYRQVARLVNRPGIVVMRWQANTQSGGSLLARGLGGLSGSRSEGHGGLVVVAGLRQSVLHVGPDIMNLAQWVPSGQLRRMKVTTHTLQTQRAFWVKELTMEAVFAAAGEFDLKNSGIRDAVTAAKIELALAKASISNLSSLGNFGDPVRTTEPVDWSELGQYDLLNNSDDPKDERWLTILTVDSEVRNLQSLIREKGWVGPAPGYVGPGKSKYLFK